MASRLPRLYVRDGDRVVEAPDADQEVVALYPTWEPKGPVRAGTRLTILAASTHVGVGAEVRVIHVLEATEPGVPLHVMGPKPVHGEYVDGALRTAPVESGADPLVPSSYDGRVLDGPGIDVSWDVTTYSFDTGGEHEIMWRPGDHMSNTLTLTVT